MNYTSKVKAATTIAEITDMLGRSGAASVTSLYADGQPQGVAFDIPTSRGRQTYHLQVDVAGVEAAIERSRARGELRTHGNFRGTEHARGVAWRILKDWLEAQLAFIEAGLAALDQIMLPFMITGNGRTVYQAVMESAGIRQTLLELT